MFQRERKMNSKSICFCNFKNIVRVVGFVSLYTKTTKLNRHSHRRLLQSVLMIGYMYNLPRIVITKREAFIISR